MDIHCNYCHLEKDEKEFKFIEDFEKYFCPICGSSDNDYNLKKQQEEKKVLEKLAQEEYGKRPPQRVIYRKLKEKKNTNALK